MPTPEDFNKAYWLSKSPAVRALALMEPYSQERSAAAIKLATDKPSLAIDMEIDAFGSQPWYSMNNRKRYGYTWVPSILQVPIPVAPGLDFPGQPRYDPNNPPAGSVKVSVDLKDYPAFDAPPPVVVPPVVAAEPNWTLRFGGWAPVQAFDNSPNGFVFEDAVRGKWVKVVIDTPFGKSAYWLKQ